MELVGESYRPVLGTGIQLAFTVGFMLQPALAYGLRDEFWYQVATYAPNFLLPFIMVLVIPESPRWLSVQGRYDEVSNLVQKMCKTNGRELPPDFHPACLIDDKAGDDDTKNCLVLLATPTMRLWTLIMDFAWFTVSLIYYALSFNSGSLYGDTYLNTFLLGAVEIPAYVLGLFLMNWKLTGRRWTGCIGLIGAAVSCFICIPMILFGFDWATTAFSILGKGFVSISFSVVYLHSNEIFPTEVRNVGVGTASMCARISTLGSSYAGGPLGSVWEPLPSLLFGSISTISGILYALLPETLGKLLPDTVEQAERLKHSSMTKPNNRNKDGRTSSSESSEVVEQRKDLPAPPDVFVITPSFTDQKNISDLTLSFANSYEKPQLVTRL